MEIRLARLADAAGIARLSRAEIEFGLKWRWRPARVQQMITQQDATVIVADSPADGSLSGFAIMTFAQEHAHLHLLAVSPSARRSGLATQLLQWLLKSCRVAGITKINLEVRRGNHGAIRFYERQGFQGAGIVRGYYQGVEDARVMRLELLPLPEGDDQEERPLLPLLTRSPKRLPMRLPNRTQLIRRPPTSPLSD